ncbi:Hydrogenase isoenzymes nickel incorporation protein HypB [Rahnella aquatilis]|nr:Hydrogenase isoenzymes nickel incorporation protein HypB [Rahnella aquatilis]
MCSTCGCASGELRIEGVSPEHTHHHSHDHDDSHDHRHGLPFAPRRLVDIEMDVLAKNNHIAAHNREHFAAAGILALNLVSSPGSGKGCHLDAQMVHDALHQLSPNNNSLLFIENVGNLVCPASFDLGELHKVAVLSVTEGEDKPLKYPHMFAASRLMVLNKIDLLPYVSFDVEACIANARQVNPQIEVIRLSATTGEGMEQWLAWLEQQRCA